MHSTLLNGYIYLYICIFPRFRHKLAHAHTVVILFSRYVYPDFLPEPDWRRRDRIREKLERLDMYRRRSVMQIPEFYVGKCRLGNGNGRPTPCKLERRI